MRDKVYYAYQRTDLIDLVPPGISKGLDVGYGAGNGVGGLRQEGVITEIIGIEPSVCAAKELTIR